MTEESTLVKITKKLLRQSGITFLPLPLQQGYGNFVGWRLEGVPQLQQTALVLNRHLPYMAFVQLDGEVMTDLLQTPLFWKEKIAHQKQLSPALESLEFIEPPSGFRRFKLLPEQVKYMRDNIPNIMTCEKVIQLYFRQEAARYDYASAMFDTLWWEGKN